VPAEPTTEKEAWETVKKMLGDRRIALGNHWAYNFRNDPKRLGFVLSRYKFAAKMAAKGRRVLELGCSEGMGAPMIAEFARNYTGVDMDADAIRVAERNWAGERMRFVEDDFLGKVYGTFDAVVSFDVVEHVVPESESLFFDTVHRNLDDDGIAVIGTPNVAAAAHASEASAAGHVNLFSAERLKAAMQTLFHNTFIFCVNDEIVHTGFWPMAHYLIGVGCYKREQRTE